VYGYQLGELPIPSKGYGLKRATTIRAHASKRNLRICSRHIGELGVFFSRPVGGIPKIACRMRDRPELSYIPFYPHGGFINQIDCVVERFGAEPLPSKSSETSKFVAYACNVLKTFFVPLDLSDLVDMDEWLENTNYSGKRKLTLRKLRDTLKFTENKHIDSKSFIKFEGYENPKHPRGINSPGDECKSFLGPLCHAIDKKTFKQRCFVKGVDPRVLPQMLLDTFGESEVLETDFTSFEGHHHTHFSEVIQFWMMHMVRRVADNNTKRIISRMVKGTNRCVFKDITVDMDESLMSGVLWTSSANGVLNLMIMSYLQLVAKYPDDDPIHLSGKFDEFVGFVEGDDGITKGFQVNNQLVSDLGINLKFKSGRNFGDVSFCGKTCDPTSGKLVIITNPLKAIVKFSTVDYKYACSRDSKQSALTRNKALSMYYAYKDMPILGVFAKRFLDLTRSIDSRGLMSETGYQRVWVEKAMKEKIWHQNPNIEMSTRLSVQKHFDVSVHAQLEIERQILDSVGSVYIDSKFVVNNAQYRHCELYQSIIEPTFVQHYSLGPFIPEIMSTNDDNGLRGAKKKYVLGPNESRFPCARNWFPGLQYSFLTDPCKPPLDLHD
jgi:hypothetical protein